MSAPPSPFGARAVALRVLLDSDSEREYASDLLEKALEDDRVTALDRSLATALVYATIRHRGTIDKVLDAFSKTETEKMEAGMRWILRLAACQLLFLEKIPAYAALDEAAEQAKRHRDKRAAGFATGVLRALQRAIVKIEGDALPATASPGPEVESQWRRTLSDVLEARWPDLPHRRLIPIPGGRRAFLDRDLWPDPWVDPAAFAGQMMSHPVWLVRRWMAKFGAAATVGAMEAGNGHPPMSIRVNALKTTREKLVERLREEKVEVDAKRLHVAHTGLLGRLASFRDGWFAVQDDAAQRVAPMLQAKAGELVGDLCAAPGGKSAQIAETGACVVAADSEIGKVKGMGKSFQRLGVSAVLALADAKQPPFGRVFDAVLVDVPCSNTGVLSRRVEARWRLRDRDLHVLARVQRRILDAAVAVTKPGGRVVYSTCSLEDEENETLVRAAIRDGNGLRLEEEMKILPGAEWTCGGYAARIRLMAR
ncbi:MAG: transcription antitermination factor NusB [Planctomycetota bacterium]